jgi:hypothetical protein
MAMVEGRLLEVVLAEIGMWMGVLVMSVVMDTKGHMVVVVVASELCDWLPWMEAQTKARLAFGSFLFWLLDRWGNFYPVICVILIIHAI